MSKVRAGILDHWAEKFQIFVRVLFLSLNSSACNVRHSISISLYILALSKSNRKNSLYSTGKDVIFGNSKLVSCRGFWQTLIQKGIILVVLLTRMYSLHMRLPLRIRAMRLLSASSVYSSCCQ